MTKLDQIVRHLGLQEALHPNLEEVLSQMPRTMACKVHVVQDELCCSVLVLQILTGIPRLETILIEGELGSLVDRKVLLPPCLDYHFVHCQSLQLFQRNQGPGLHCFQVGYSQRRRSFLCQRLFLQGVLRMRYLGEVACQRDLPFRFCCSLVVYWFIQNSCTNLHLEHSHSRKYSFCSKQYDVLCGRCGHK